MVYKIDGMTMKEIFKSYDRDYFSVCGCDALIDFFDEVNGENFEFDPIAVCCDCNEYGENVTLKFSDMLFDFGHLLDDEPNEEEDDIEKLVEILEKHTTVLHVANGNYIVFNF